MQSKNCKDELNYARDLDKELLLIYLEEVILPAGMAMRLNRIQAINWYMYDEITLTDAYHKLFATSGISITRLIPEQPLQAPASTSSVPQQISPAVTPHPVAVSSTYNASQTAQPSSLATAFSIVSLCIGIFSLITSICFGGVFGIVGLILGIIALANRNNKHKAMAIWGTVLSSIAFIASVGLFILSITSSHA